MIQFHFSAKTDVGLVRKANEDNLGNALTPNGHVFVVCDGMGGHVGGAKASQIAVSSILEFFKKQEYDNLFTAIDRSLVFANEQIYAVSMAEPELKGMGTTAVILIVKGDACFIGHVGDSRIYLKSGGKLNRITKDHSFVQTLVDSGLITDEAAESHPKKNQILKALGIGPIVEPTVADSPIFPKNGDVFLLCSDGMNGMVNDASMEMMIDENDLDKSSSVLIQAAKDSGGHDNITVTLVNILESPHNQSVFKHFNPIHTNAFSNTHNLEPTAQVVKPFFKNKYFYIADEDLPETELVLDLDEIEEEFCTEALPVSLIGMNADQMKQYIHFVADMLLESHGAPKVSNESCPFEWMQLLSIDGKTNFFEKRVSEYSKAGLGVSREEQVFTLDADF
jgi:serine/threonine protein phosphatase PrpC